MLLKSYTKLGAEKRNDSKSFVKKYTSKNQIDVYHFVVALCFGLRFGQTTQFFVLYADTKPARFMLKKINR